MSLEQEEFFWHELKNNDSWKNILGYAMNRDFASLNLYEKNVLHSIVRTEKKIARLALTPDGAIEELTRNGKTVVSKVDTSVFHESLEQGGVLKIQASLGFTDSGEWFSKTSKCSTSGLSFSVLEQILTKPLGSSLIVMARQVFLSGEIERLNVENGKSIVQKSNEAAKALFDELWWPGLWEEDLASCERLLLESETKTGKGGDKKRI